MRDVRIRGVPVADRIGRARDGRRHTERPRGAADERRLPHAELACDGDDVTGAKVRREPTRNALGLLRGGRLERDHGGSLEALRGRASGRRPRLRGPRFSAGPSPPTGRYPPRERRTKRQTPWWPRAPCTTFVMKS